MNSRENGKLLFPIRSVMLRQPLYIIQVSLTETSLSALALPISHSTCPFQSACMEPATRTRSRLKKISSVRAPDDGSFT